MKPDSCWLLLLFCCLFSPALKEQQIPQIIRSFPVPEQLTVSADGQGNIVLSTPDGDIQKFSPAGTLLHTFSPSSASYFSAIDARFSMQVLAFDENSQQIIYLDRFLNLNGNIQLPPEHFNFISALGWSGSGNTVWVYDAADMQVIRWRTDTREIISTLKLNQLLNRPIEVKALYEHQHKLYLLSADRLLIFDPLGNFDKELPLPEWISATFSGEELLCLTKQNMVEFTQLYSGKKKIVGFPSENSYQKIQIGKGEIYLFSNKLVDVYHSVP